MAGSGSAGIATMAGQGAAMQARLGCDGPARLSIAGISTLAW